MSKPITVCPKCGWPMPPACPTQDGNDNQWYLRQSCDNPQCRQMTVNQGPYEKPEEVPSGVVLAQGPGK